MGITVKVCFRATISVSAIAGIILFSAMRMNSSWSLAPLILFERLNSSTHQQLDDYWRIPSDATLLPFENSSIEVYIDLENFRKQVRDQNQQCRDLKVDPVTLFKSQPSNTTRFTAELDRKRLELAFMCGGVLYPEFLTTPPRETLYPFEAFYLSDPPLWDESTVASHRHSTISLYGSKTKFIVGDAVSIVIKMFDRKGRPRLKGGDRIQVLVKDVHFKHGIIANITDFNNGTYLATTVLPWAGTVRFKAVLRQPREYFRALAYVHRTIKTTIAFGGAYNNSKANETAPCSAFPLVPGYQKSELCNLTVENGPPWYCGRPSKRELNCSDYQYYTQWKPVFINKPITPAENRLLMEWTNQNEIMTQKLVLSVEATESGLKRMQDPNVPCNKVSPRSTWHQSEPTGYLYHEVWKPFLCFVPDKVEKVDVSCLKNVKMFFYGDSNGRMLYDRIRTKMECKETAFDEKDALLIRVRKKCQNEKDNITLQYRSHSHPSIFGFDKLYSTSFLLSPRTMFDLIPSESRYILHFSHYLHITSYHISVYERTLIAIRDELNKLLKRNPNGLILLRGPHFAELDKNMGDSWAQYITAIQKETFRDLQDRILYFPTWDLSTLSEIPVPHPVYSNQMTDTMLQFLCGRDE